jgi:FtsH-binding integral membrane protein
MFFWSETMEFVISVGGAVLFCGFILFDTHLIMHKMSPEEYVMASVTLYLDFINLFIYILRIMQAARGRD